MENVIANGFVELSSDETMDVDGGIGWAAIAAGVVKVCTVAGGLVSGGPVIGAVIIVGGAVALGVGIYNGVKNA